MQLRDGLGSDHLSQTHQRLRIRHFFHSHPTETAIDHVGSYFPLQNFVTPVAHMFHNQHAQGYFRRRLLPSSNPALRMSLALRVVDGIQQLLIF
jgi:hypothetical protein